MVFLFYGENTFAARAKIRELIDRYKSKSGDFGLERFWGGDPTLTADKIVAAITSVPFLAETRLVIIEDLLANKTVAEKVLPALGRVPDSTVVVFYEPAADKRTKLFKELTKLAKTAEFKPLGPVQLKNWLIKAAHDQGARLDSRVASQLIERAGDDQWRLSNELAKLAGGSQEITEDSIRELVEPTFNQTIFNLVESLTRGQVSRSLALYAGLRAAKSEPHYVVAMIGWQLRNLLLVKASGKPPAITAKEAGMSPFVASKSAQVAAGVGVDELKRAYNIVADLDWRLKTAVVNSDGLVEEAMYRIGTQLAATGSATS